MFSFNCDLRRYNQASSFFAQDAAAVAAAAARAGGEPGGLQWAVKIWETQCAQFFRKAAAVLAPDDFRRLVRRALDIMSTEVWPKRYCSGPARG